MENSGELKEFTVDKKRLDYLYKEIVQILNNIRTNESGLADFEILATYLLQTECLLGNQDGCPDIMINPLNNDPSLGDSTLYGQYMHSGRCIILNSKNIEKCINGEIPLTKIIVAIGHENTHYLQHRAEDEYQAYKQKWSTLDDNQKEYAKKKEEYLKNLKLDQMGASSKEWEDFYYMIKDHLSNQIVQAIESYPKEERYKFFEQIALAQYLNLKHEEDARVNGIQFVVRKFTEIHNHPACDSELKKYLNQQKPYIIAMAEEEKNNQKKYYPMFEFLEKELSSLSLQTWEETFKKYCDFKTYGEYFYDSYNDYLKSDEYKILSMHQKQARDSLTKMTRILFKNKSKTELETIYESVIKGGYKHLYEILEEEIINSFSGEEYSKLKKKSYKLLTEEDCVYGAVRILPQKEFLPQTAADLIEDLLKMGKVAIAREIFLRIDPINNDTKSFEDNQKAYESIIKNVIEFAKQLAFKIKNKNDEDIVYQDMSCITEFLTIGDNDVIPDEYIQILEEILKQHPIIKNLCKKLEAYATNKKIQYKNADKETKYKNMQKVYGKVYTDSFILEETERKKEEERRQTTEKLAQEEKTKRNAGKKSNTCNLSGTVNQFGTINQPLANNQPCNL